MKTESLVVSSASYAANTTTMQVRIDAQVIRTEQEVMPSGKRPAFQVVTIDIIVTFSPNKSYML